MTRQFTPGPWQVSGTRHSGDLRIGRDARLHAVGPDGDAVAMVFFDMKTGRGLKDARLIAASPELLEALQQFVTEYVELVDSGDAGFWDAETEPKVINARAAIAKATGASS